MSNVTLYTPLRRHAVTCGLFNSLSVGLMCIPNSHLTTFCRRWENLLQVDCKSMSAVKAFYNVISISVLTADVAAHSDGGHLTKDINSLVSPIKHYCSRLLISIIDYYLLYINFSYSNSNSNRFIYIAIGRPMTHHKTIISLYPGVHIQNETSTLMNCPLLEWFKRITETVP